MQIIFKTYLGIFLLFMLSMTGIGVLSAHVDVCNANDYKSSVIAEIENSNFNKGVIHSCIAQAEKAGYQLEVKTQTYDEDGNVQIAEIILHYQYSIGLLNIRSDHQTRGYAV